MTLNIKNIGMIEELDKPIEFEGITVLVGDNNTGKSTISKVLYCIYSSFYKIDTQVINYIDRNIMNYIDNLSINDFIFRRGKLSNELLSKFHELNNNNDVKMIVLDYLKNNKIKYDETLLDKIIDNIKKLLSKDKEEIKKIVINEKFSSIFHSNIRSLFNNSKDNSEIDLCLSKKHIVLNFEKDILKTLEAEVNVLHSPIYYDGPHIIGDYFHSFSLFPNRYSREFVDKLRNNNSMSYEQQEAKSIVNGLFDAFDSFGDLNIDLDNDTIELKGLKKPLDVCSLSNGLKTIVLLKNLLESGNIVKEDVLILDEPEINLHPGWQLEMARILVELQKRLDLTILISTHSPYFLNAIDTYSYVCEINDKCRYYLCTSENNKSNIKDVSNNVDEMYESLSEPFNNLIIERQNFFNDREN